MAYRIRRRDFLKITVVSAVTIGAGPLAGCSGDDGGEDESPSPPADVLRVFPQGLASGDPRPDSVILWTRAAPGDGDDGKVTFKVARDEAFTDLVAEGELTAEAENDYTVRVKVTNLEPYTTYYYRFKAQGVRSDIGRTKTAPAPDQAVDVRFAFATCQDFVGRYYHAWKALVDEAADRVDFVLHLGDYVYETDGDPDFMTPTEERKIVLPDGLDIGSSNAAVTLADYRSLYKQYRSDPNLKEAHRLFPFICIWDDHEFGNDCWQDHTTHFNDTMGTEEVPEQREAADQAWHEYQPADVEYDASASYPNDIKIYRTLRYGKHIELFLTDQRYYRSDHVIPEGPIDASVGKILENSEIGARIFVLKSGFDPREAAAMPTMLGDAQKAWFIDAVTGSTATWKFWGSETQLAQMLADLSSFMSLPDIFRDKWYLTVDQWDGYRTERAEILSALSGVSNLVVLTGDIHAFYASELHVDFDNPGATPAAVEYVVAGISSQAIAPGAQSVLSQPTFASLGLGDLVPEWDQILVQASPHYRYANSFANGVALCDVSEGEVKVTYLIVGDVQNKDDTGVKHRAVLRTAAGANTVETLEMT